MMAIGDLVKLKSWNRNTPKHNNKTSKRLIFDKFLSMNVKKKKERIRIYIIELI